ncbi:ATP-binding cassette domain-containing protein [Microbacteriaceae bacterium VKM Ac-2854]|nr:ATP-binding cassette domain-containing protein [Microbacteriaceae bacterium VKM Ac-2854]
MLRSPAPLAELVDVAADYGAFPVLTGVSARFDAGCVSVIAGPNGSGKSTLLAVLAGLHPARVGLVRRAGRVAFVPQRSALSDRLPLTVRELVRMGRWADRGAWRPLRRADRVLADECLEALDLTALAAHPLAELSGGQRQRALVAQGLAQRAEVLLLDEPTAGVDAASLPRIAGALLAEAARGAVVVHASHDPAAIAAADAVLRLP